MKKIIVLFVILFSVSAVAMESEPPAKEEKEKPPEVWCPATRFTDNSKCMDCHQMIRVDGKPKFGLKELPLSANHNEIPGFAKLVKDGPDGFALYMEVSSTNSSYFRRVADYLSWHPEIRKLIVEMNSFGGSIMDAWRTVGIIKEMQASNIIIEMRCYGIAASAGTIIFVAGDIDHRFVNPNAELMIHKIWTFKMFSIDTPDSAEDQAETMLHFQTNINNFILSRCKMTKRELDDKIFKKDFWMTGRDAVSFGIADGFIGK